MNYHDAKEQAIAMFGKLPEGWRLERIRDFAELATSNIDKKSEEGEMPVKLCNYVDVYKNYKITADLDFMEATASEAQIERFSIRGGDVIITKDSETPDDIGVPSLVVETIPGVVCGYHLTIIRPDQQLVVGEYLLYALLSRMSAFQFYLAANGVTRFGLTYQGTKNLRIAFPPVETQRLIVSYLDGKMAAISDLIGGKQTRIEKLEGNFANVIASLAEYRTELITAATSGKIDLRKAPQSAA